MPKCEWQLSVLKQTLTSNTPPTFTATDRQIHIETFEGRWQHINHTFFFSFYRVSFKGWVISEGIFDLVLLSSKKRTKSLSLTLSTFKVKRTLKDSSFWEWDKIENTFWDYPLLKQDRRTYYVFNLLSQNMAADFSLDLRILCVKLFLWNNASISLKITCKLVIPATLSNLIKSNVLHNYLRRNYLANFSRRVFLFTIHRNSSVVSEHKTTY